MTTAWSADMQEENISTNADIVVAASEDEQSGRLCMSSPNGSFTKANLQSFADSFQVMSLAWKLSCCSWSAWPHSLCQTDQLQLFIAMH